MQKEGMSFHCASYRFHLCFSGVCLLTVASILCFTWTIRAQTVPMATGKPATAPTPQDESGNRAGGRNPQYVIDSDDVLRISVIDVPQFSRDYRVGPDGTITIPMLSAPVRASGLTLSQLSESIVNRLRSAGLVSYPHVVVSVKSSHAHAVAITGAVRDPQIYSIFAPTTLLDVLSRAGGLAPDAGNTAVISRGNADPPLAGQAEISTASRLSSSTKVNLQSLLSTGNPNLNVEIYPGDKVTVERAGVVYVVGAVVRPGGFTLSDGRDNMTVLQAVALGEGLKPTAIRKKAMIIRRESGTPNGREEIAVNLRKILAGQVSDPHLQANDILFVPESTSKRALRRGAEAAVQMATGLVIWGRY